MRTFLSIFTATFAGLFRRQTIGYFLMTVVLSVALILALWGSVAYLIHGMTESWVAYLGDFASFLLVWFLFPLFTPLIAGMLQDKVLDGLELQNTAGLQQSLQVSLGQDIGLALRTCLKMIVVNLVCLPLYFIPLINIIVACGVNAWVLGGEYFHTVSMRYVGRVDIKRQYKRNRMVIVLVGLLIYLTSLIPVLNLMTPIVAVTMMYSVCQVVNNSPR